MAKKPKETGEERSKLQGLVVVLGDDGQAVRKRAKEWMEGWIKETGGNDVEILEGGATQISEAKSKIGKLREAILTLPFFGGGKVVWWKDVTFLADEKLSGHAEIVQALDEILTDMARVVGDSVRLVISAEKIDKRRVFYKNLEKMGNVEWFLGLSMEDRDWEDRAKIIIRQDFDRREVQIEEMALQNLVSRVGADVGMLHSEAEKLCVYVGERRRVGVEDVETMVVARKHAKAFALSEALGDRDLARTLKTLDRELWEMKTDSRKSVIGLLYGVIHKIRLLVLAKAMVGKGMLRAQRKFYDFKAQAEEMPKDFFEGFPDKMNPSQINSYQLFVAVNQAGKYEMKELVRALKILLHCNRSLISSRVDQGVLLQGALVEIIKGSI